ncbi:MAG: ATP-dependent Clp protease ATP-binding subunit [Lachnospiraceae bacterium]|nr:ATP-dependent Clp protease ATP-binding subunit [Lachnospiraceae bacterium]
MMQNYTNEAKKAISYATKSAASHNQNYAGTEHLLVGLLRTTDGTAAGVLAEAGVTPDKLTQLIDKLIAPQGDTTVKEQPGFSPRAEKVIKQAVSICVELGSREIGTEHLLLAMLRDTECVGTRLLHTMGADVRKLYADTLAAMNLTGKFSDQDLLSGKAMREPESGTPTLDRYSRDLTAMAKEGKLDPVVGRESEILRVVQILSRRTKNNPCLIGEPGVGKTAIVEGLAARIASGEVPESMQDKRIAVLDLSGMVAGSKYRGEFEERIKNVVKEVAGNRSILLFIDELHTIIGAGGAEGSLDASNILKPSLSRGEIQVIGATTIEEYRKYIEKDAALERRFQPVSVEEPTEEQSVEILKGLRPYYEEHHSVRIADEALTAAVKLSERYINDRRLPDKAIDLIDEAASKVRISGFRTASGLAKDEEELLKIAAEKEQAVLTHDMVLAAKLQKKQDALKKKVGRLKNKKTGSRASQQLTVSEESIAAVVAEWTGIPVSKLREEESRRLARLEKELHKRVIGQEEAVSAVAAAIRRGRVGLKDPNRPTGSFLFLGPTGVGKTELSKAVAETVFGSEQNMIRVDMSEYMEKYSVSKLIGSPPGYVGYEEGGQLSEQVRRHPYSVILFDEIEKAHPDVFNILLQVLDDGHITDAHGHRVDFKNTCIIMTSNAGAKAIVDPKHLGFGAGQDAKKDYESMKRGVMDEVRRLFKPEFLNRIDETIVFHPLNEEEVAEIAGLLLEKLKKRAAEQMNLTLKISGAAKKYIAKQGYSPKYGARPVRRVIQSELENPLAEMLLRGEAAEGSCISIGIKDGKLLLRTEE